MNIICIICSEMRFMGKLIMLVDPRGKITYSVCIKNFGKIDSFQILLQNLKIIQSTSLERRHTFASGFSTTRSHPGRQIPEGP